MAQTLIQLTNTFNEFRAAYNNAANTIDSLETTLNTITGGGGGAGISGSTITANVLNANNIIHNGLTSTRIPFANTDSYLLDDGDLTYTAGTNTLNVANLNVTTVTSNLTVGGSDKVVANATSGNLNVYGNIVAGNNLVTLLGANGTIQLTGNVELSGAEGLVTSYHGHFSKHVVGGPGNVEDWTTAKGQSDETHHVVGIGDQDASVDIAVVNQNDGANAYSEFIAINDAGDIENGWVSMGLNSSNYGEGEYAVTKADDAYILYQPPSGTIHPGDLVIGTGGNGTQNRIIFSANGFDDPANNTQMTITPDQSVRITINTESSNTSTGALVVNGGIGLNGNLNVGGNVAITGTITLGGGGNTVSTSSLTVDSPIIFVGQNNAADTFDLGFVGEYNDGTEKYTGFVRDASASGMFKLFANTSILPANTVDFTDSNLTYGSVMIGSAEVVDSTTSTSTTTGALIVSGGVGVAENAYVGGLIRSTSTQASTSTSTGAVVVSGGVGVAGNTHIGGELVVADARVTGLLTTESVAEVTSDITGNGVTTFNYNNGTVFAVTPTANFTPNFTNVPETASRVHAMTLIITQGATKYDISGVQIDGAAQTIKYAGNTTPTFTANKTEIVVFTLIRTSGGAWTVLGQLSQYG